MPKAELYRFGYMPGDKNCWCAGCNREFKGGMIMRGRKTVLSWNCRPCAAKQTNGLETELVEAGYEE